MGGSVSGHTLQRTPPHAFTHTVPSPWNAQTTQLSKPSSGASFSQKSSLTLSPFLPCWRAGYPIPSFDLLVLSLLWLLPCMIIYSQLHMLMSSWRTASVRCTCFSAMWPCHSPARRWNSSCSLGSRLWGCALCLLTIVANGDSDAMLVWDTAINWPRIFYFLPLGSRPLRKKGNYPTTSIPHEIQAMWRGPRRQDAMSREMGGKVSRRQMCKEAISGVNS